jgi:hypothetical protein
MVGGTATSHKFNLANPVDSDAAFRLTFVGGGTHSSNGYLPNGSNAYANTFLLPSTSLTNNSTHLSYYSRTDALRNANEIGAITSSGIISLITRFGDGNLYADQYNFTTNRIVVANPNSTGLYISSRTSATSFKVFKNNTQFGTTNTNTSTPSVNTITSSMVIGAVNSNTVPVNFSNRECAFSSIGDGLTDAEALAFYNAVQAFQTTLNRQV